MYHFGNRVNSIISEYKRDIIVFLWIKQVHLKNFNYIENKKSNQKYQVSDDGVLGILIYFFSWQDFFCLWKKKSIKIITLLHLFPKELIHCIMVLNLWMSKFYAYFNCILLAWDIKFDWKLLTYIMYNYICIITFKLIG